MPPIGFNDYQRIFRVITSILDGIDGAQRKGRACLFYSVAGAMLLSHHHRRDARPVAGAALYLLDAPTNTVLAFAQLADDGQPVSNREAFHSWVECDGYAIDFMAPVFTENAAEYGRSLTVPRRMFQKPLSAMTASHFDFKNDGDFYLAPDDGLTHDLLERFVGTPAARDLVEICAHWHRPFPKPIKNRMQVGSDDGTVTTVRLSTITVEGEW